jgi:hypothetical protein
VVGTDKAATFGILEPQIGVAQGSTSLSNATINGNFILSTDTPASAKVPDLTAGVTFDGASALAGTSDESTSTSNMADQALTGTYSVTNTPVNGHGTLMMTQSGEPPASFLFLMFADQKCVVSGWTAGFRRYCKTWSPPFASKMVAIPADATQANPAVLTFALSGN